MASMREIAAEAGVSLKTVSRVFNDDPHVRPELRARVQRALADHDYVPNELAQTFRSGRVKVVGIAVPSLVDPFYAAIVEAVSVEAQQHGYGTLVTPTGFDAIDERRNVASLFGRRIAGLILASVSPDQSYLTGSVPTVLVDQPAVGIDLDSFVHEDNTGAARATRHLLDHGLRRIGFIGRAPQLATMTERRAGYRDALEHAGIAYDGGLVVADIDTVDDAASAYTKLRASGIDALFTADPRSTISCLPSLQRDPVPFVGFGDFPLAGLVTPAVTVIDQSPEVMGRRAARHLMDLIQSSESTTADHNRRTRLPVSLTERRSCLPPETWALRG
jgi:LacI family transcriptional regulator